MSSVIDKVKSRGHWHVVIRPDEFNKKHVPSARDLLTIISQSRVDYGGSRWEFPYFDGNNPTLGVDWIEASVDGGTHLESWRMYQSGLFVGFFGVWSDWRDQSYFEGPPVGWRAGAVLPVADTVVRYTEILEFAARLALTPAGADRMHLTITLRQLADRTLWMDVPNRRFFSNRTASLAQFPQSFDMPRQDLIAQPKHLALQAAGELFDRFSWTPGPDLLRDLQRETQS